MGVIMGYTEVTPAKAADVNINKMAEENVLRILDGLRNNGSYDPRWLAIGRTMIEQGFMAINRGIMQPQRLSNADMGINVSTGDVGTSPGPQESPGAGGEPRPSAS